jgi:hypothetical protein
MEIIYSRRGLSLLFFGFTILFVLLGLLMLLAGLGNAIEPVPWKDKGWAVLGWCVAGLSWLLGIQQMWEYRQAYATNVARIGTSRFSLHTLAGHDIQFVFSDVRKVSWNPGLRARQCTVETDSMIYSFDARSCPRTAKVARLIAERSGLELHIQGSPRRG